MNVLVTGGAGFIGSHLVPLLVARGHDVTIYDNLSPQIHTEGAFPVALQEQATCIRADVRDMGSLREALRDTEVVVHLAAETGTGQSMYDIHHYTEVNALGTAAILDTMMNQPNRIQRFILASSRAVYGEGQYVCAQCGTVYPPTRTAAQLQRHEWELRCPRCGAPATPVPTQEDALLQPQSVYASGKQTQEQLVTIVCQAREIEAVVLRYQNVYGPGQALANPYTGVICVFFTLLMQEKPLLLFEDGLPSRDFVFIDDVAGATCAAVEAALPGPTVINVGTGEQTTIRAVAETVAAALGVELRTELTEKYRLGDIRHCYADSTRLREQLAYTPRIDFPEGIAQFVAWARTQEQMMDQVAGRFEHAQDELIARKLFR